MNILQLGIFGVKRHKEEKAKRLNVPPPLSVKDIKAVNGLNAGGEETSL
jgi:hypothetical protein